MPKKIKLTKRYITYLKRRKHSHPSCNQCGHMFKYGEKAYKVMRTKRTPGECIKFYCLNHFFSEPLVRIEDLER